MKKFSHYFLPHPQTHQKAHLLSWHFLLIYLLLFMLLRVGLDLVSIYQPGVLGVAANINMQRVIEETNRERQQKGFPPLVENPNLAAAARAKAANMFEENYWAHFSPTGKDPWGFITKSGYKFVYAGENLAKNFQTSEEVVQAWMNSSSHRDNLLNSKYQEIGIAVVDGTLQGQQTTLVVQMFGTPYTKAAVPQSAPQTDLVGKKVSLDMAPAEVGPASQTKEPSQVVPNREMVVAGSNIQSALSLNKPLIDPVALTKTVSLIFMGLISILLLLDLIILRRRGVFRISSHHLAHLSFLAVSGAAILASNSGDILQGLTYLR
ncbi:MAG: hypothetical protein UU73_C0001G0217 [Candidatus Daviesbacteria bacterium GW2011_GWA1_41_61]|uniref:SCP domain-containing protein n=1 Tax=Candidatus Daviesbacteria bacterium GW2011_GWA2_40_9 TaxID=1618424 RepID=A0A0G0WEA4_9BACT|nr:MAG: hypothetical protein UU26_C0017G0013 [Candidatus Daviesbacteria bacterium GW2011_GWC1_40_9]KKR82585.1 MAG: hypothetical protein UU29_C0011G0032 [Candidatus Daviesbacteria bacterium GW2011_GWA2_40_9]KKR93036.1 MAG: hypothetical protein UU44_C0004G0218 [Candidatus Daviesbacteria bacterium GW2011_GWB1_41_15]KKS15580.1 MAG: hypothetical protein UU73_C0001G0217 [Candidatus Daviesbacteria bacterium GW2011_GWA1_41_61]